jgi:hypothetical protein
LALASCLNPGSAEGLLKLISPYNVDKLKPIVDQKQRGDRLDVSLYLESEGLAEPG